MQVVVLRGFVATAAVDELYLARVRKLIAVIETFTAESVYRQFRSDVRQLKAEGLSQEDAMMKLLGKYTN